MEVLTTVRASIDLAYLGLSPKKLSGGLGQLSGRVQGGCWGCHVGSLIWPWGINYGDPILRWMNIHLPPILMFTRGTG